MQERCRKCGAVLFEIVLVDKDVPAVMGRDKAGDVVRDGEDTRFRCPRCEALHVFHIVDSDPRRVVIAGWKEATGSGQLSRGGRACALRASVGV